MNQKLYTFADLFAGCGGLSLGLSQAGLKGIFAIERDSMAFKTFSSNLIERHSRYKLDWPEWLEKTHWDIETLLAIHKRNLVENLRGKIDVLAGGPPCQGFSFAGRRIEDDPRNLMFEKYVEVVEALQPKCVIIENVPGMQVAHLRSNVVEMPVSGAPKTKRKSYFDKLVDSLAIAGYCVRAERIDSSRFGIPQKRSRLIAIGVRRELTDNPGRVFELLEIARSEQLRLFGLSEQVSARNALSDLETNDHNGANRERINCSDPDSGPGFQELRYVRPSKLTRYQDLMRDGYDGAMNSMRLARHREHVEKRFALIIKECAQGVRMNDKDRSRYGLKKHRIYPMDGNKPAPTVTTLPDDILHYSEPRILTVRESARLQSFPDWFKFEGKFTTGGHRRAKECPRYTQVGNAVPPLLGRAIGVAVCKLLEEVAGARSLAASARTLPVVASA
ncbi:MAG: DNA cytosine methyltransferase [Aquamicrobium sp.]|nr:DNA cytosine methyltransferase [Aquamicrobium sp.]